MATLKDIAKECGCDISTVSRALQNSPRVKPKTIEKVRKAAEKLGYKPNIVAQALARGRTQVIALLVPSLVSESENLPAMYLSQLLLPNNYDLIICQYHENEEMIKRQLNRIEQGGADGLIITGSEISMSTFGTLLKDFKIPYIFLDRHNPDLKTSTITSDNLSASRQLTSVLVKEVDALIHFHLRENAVEQKRLQGFKDEVGSKPYVHYKEDLEKFLNENKISKLGFIASVQESISIYQEKYESLLKSYDCSIAVYDHWHGPYSGYDNIFLATQDWEKISKTAVDKILSLINGEKASQEIIEIPFVNVQNLK